MKRVGNLFSEISEWSNLRLAVAKSLKGKRARSDARDFVQSLDTNLQRLSCSLRNGTATIGRVHQFTIHDPKKRLITAPCFEERVLHHAILNVCEPHFEKWLIEDSFACRKGKGRIACLQRANEYSRRYEAFLKFDIQKYFDSIDHEILKCQLKRRFKDCRLLELFARIIDSHSVSPGNGLPIGSLTSQHFANFYLGWFDRFAKEKLQIPGYVRYMDDIVCWGESTSRLRSDLGSIVDFLQGNLGLAIKENVHVNYCRHGIDLLGVRVFPTHHTLNRRSRRRFASKLARVDGLLTAGRIEENEAQRASQALVAFTRTAGLRSWRYRRCVIQRLTGYD